MTSGAAVAEPPYPPLLPEVAGAPGSLLRRARAGRACRRVLAAGGGRPARLTAAARSRHSTYIDAGSATLAAPTTGIARIVLVTRGGDSTPGAGACVAHQHAGRQRAAIVAPRSPVLTHSHSPVVSIALAPPSAGAQPRHAALRSRSRSTRSPPGSAAVLTITRRSTATSRPTSHRPPSIRLESRHRATSRSTRCAARSRPMTRAS
jgi:hypothetical protein